MRLKPFLVTSFCAVLLAGCVEQKETTLPPAADFCLIADPMYFKDEAVVSWLSDNDPSLLEGITVHNEQVERICS